MKLKKICMAIWEKKKSLLLNLKCVWVHCLKWMKGDLAKGVSGRVEWALLSLEHCENGLRDNWYNQISLKIDLEENDQ